MIKSQQSTSFNFSQWMNKGQRPASPPPRLLMGWVAVLIREWSLDLVGREKG